MPNPEETERMLEAQFAQATTPYDRGRILIKAAQALRQTGDLEGALAAVILASDELKASVAVDWPTEVVAWLAEAKLLEEDCLWRMRHPDPRWWQRALHWSWYHLAAGGAALSFAEDNFQPL